MESEIVCADPVFPITFNKGIDMGGYPVHRTHTSSASGNASRPTRDRERTCQHGGIDGFIRLCRE